MNKNFTELYNVVEDIRKKQYPNISSDLLLSVLTQEHSHQDNEVEAYKKVKEIVEEALKIFKETDGNL